MEHVGHTNTLPEDHAFKKGNKSNMYAEGKLNRNLEQVGGRIAVEKATSEMRLRNDEEIWYLPTIKSIPLRCK